MPSPSPDAPKSPVKAFAIIGGVVVVAAGAFAYTAGWFSPHRTTPTELVNTLVGPKGPPLGHRRNHAKGICFTGVFDANGNGTSLSTAQVLKQGEYPVVGRFNIGGSDPKMADPMAQVRGFSTRITTPDGGDWRGAAIDAPAFAARTPQDFFAFLAAAGNKDPNAIKQYLGAHPVTLAFVGWAKNHIRTESWSEDHFNSLNSFYFVDASGAKHAVRWSWVPAAKAVNLTPDELAKEPPDFLEHDITQRVGAGPQRWELMLTVANPGDNTADPTQPWPTDRRTVDAGTLVVQQIVPEANGPCRDINYDPSVLPAGITTSDDGFPAARSAAYRVSYDGRMGEQSHYPHSGEPAALGSAASGSTKDGGKL